jgi:type I restriction enzyme S subunit
LDDLEGLQASDYSTYQIFEANDLAFKLIDLENIKTSRVGHVPRRGIMSPAYIRLCPSKSAHSRFYYWYFFAAYLNNIFNGMGGGVRQNLTPTDLLEFPVPLPDLPTQKAIAAFLDRETARIDQLIEKKQRLVELLGERDDAAVNTAVEAPGRATKLKRHVRILPGYAFKSDEFTENPDDVRLLRGINIMPGALRWDEVRYWPSSDVAQFERFRLRSGDIVMGMDRPWVSGGMRVAQVSDQDVPALLLQRVCKIAPRGTLYPDFLLLLLRSRLFLAYFEPILTGVSVPHISGDQIGDFSFGYVPVEQQKVRAEKALLELRRSDSLRRLAMASIDRLKEYRSALITSAVTGQIDVETWSRRGEGDRRLDRIEEEMAR